MSLCGRFSVDIPCWHTRPSCAHLVEGKCIPDDHFPVLNDRNRGTQTSINIFGPKILRDDSARNTHVCLHVCLLLFTKKKQRVNVTKVRSSTAGLLERSDSPNGTLWVRWWVPERSWRDDACLYTSPYTAPCFRDPSGHAWSLLTAHPSLPPSQPPGSLRHARTQKHTGRRENRVTVLQMIEN